MKLFEEYSAYEKSVRRVIADVFVRDEEANLVDDLRIAGDLAISLVAEEE